MAKDSGTNSNGTLYVQFGCGLCAPEKWLNFDASPTLRAQRLPLMGPILSEILGISPKFPPGVQYGNVIRGLPVADGTCRGVYCSHVLEHLSLADLRLALRNVKRILHVGGTFRFVLPDLENAVDIYRRSPELDAAVGFVKSTGLGMVTRPRGLMEWLRFIYGNSRHLWMWDYKSLAAELADAGFCGIRRATCGDSSDKHFLLVEDPVRWADALGIECFAGQYEPPS